MRFANEAYFSSYLYIFLQWAPLASETTHAMYTSEYSTFTSNDTLYKNQPSNEIMDEKI